MSWRVKKYLLSDYNGEVVRGGRGVRITLPALSEADRADMEAFLADMLLIYPVLGINPFESVDAPGADAASPRLTLKGKDARAEGRETSEGFVVYEGGRARLGAVPSMHAYANTLRANLLAEGVFIEDDGQLRLTQDYVFTSPSNAAMVFLARTANGRVEWKDAHGITLKELQERSVAT